MGFGDFAPSLLGELLLLEVGVGLRRVAGLGGGLAGVVDSDLLWAGLVEVGLAVGLPSACGFGNRGGLLRGRDPPPDTSDAVDPADPVLRMASLSSCSSESADLAESNEAALLMAPPELLLTIPLVEMVTTSPPIMNSGGGPASGALAGFSVVMVMLSGPLDSDPARMNIFWCGGVIAMGEVASCPGGELGGWEPCDKRVGLVGGDLSPLV